MEARLKYIGINIIVIPVTLYLIWGFLEEDKTHILSFATVLLSSLIGISLGVIYGESVSRYLKRAHFVVTLLAGFVLILLLHFLKIDEVKFIDSLTINLAFYLIAMGYKSEVIGNSNHMENNQNS